MDSFETDGPAGRDLPAGVTPLAPEEKILVSVGLQYDSLKAYAWAVAVPAGLAFAFVCMIPLVFLSEKPTLGHGALFLVLACIPIVPVLRMWRRYCERRRLIVTSRRTIGVTFGDPGGIMEIPHGGGVRVLNSPLWLRVKGGGRRLRMWGVPDVWQVAGLIENLIRNTARRNTPVTRENVRAGASPPAPAPKEEAVEIIRSSTLSHLTDRLAGLLKHSIRFKTRRTEMAHVPLGVSRMGGVPDLPTSIPWPVVEGLHLTFLAQLRMADVAALDVDGLLPGTGWLYFFADASGEIPGYGQDGKVVYFDGGEEDMVRAEDPAFPVFAHGHAACLLELRSEWTLPGFDVALPIDYGTEMTIASGEVLRTEPKEYRALLEALTGRRRAPFHRVLGHPEEVQGGVALEWAMKRHGVCYNSPDWRDRLEGLLGETGDWVLLLQVDTDEDGPGWVWGDVGSAYFGIHKSDLAVRRFDRTCFTEQCC